MRQFLDRPARLRRLCLRTLAVLTMAVLGSLVFAGVAASNSGSSSDFTYTVNPPYVQVASDVMPNGLPYCRSSTLGSIICYSPNYIQTAYNFNPLYAQGITGAGQTVVIVDAFGSPTIQSDLTRFDQLFGIPAPPSFTILCGNGTCPTVKPGANMLHDVFGWTVETSLDVEYAHAMAPGANIVLDVASTSSGSAINTAEAAAIAQYPGSIMSQSFGIPEIFIHNNNAQVLQANKNYNAAQQAGITVFASSGDTGATFGFSTTMANFPASNPLNTGVGGTMGDPYIPLGTPDSCASGATCSAGLATVMGPSPGGCTLGRLVPPPCIPTGYGGEQVWNEPSFGSATGGAPSLLFGVPSYQNGLGLTARTTPDISYNGAINGGVLVAYSATGTPVLFIVGGTSAGSPQWAAIGALANQYSANHGHGPLGFINPALYTLAESSAYSTDFHDITVGNNQLTGTPVGFNAGTGYDDASGWGTPNVANLVPDLVKTVFP